jgi:hypothetical protein
MTSLHQLKLDYEFTPEELQYLLTTQRLAEENILAWVKDTSQPEYAYATSLNDVRAFGFEIQDAINDNRLTIPIKMGVVYWLTGLWQTMFNAHNTSVPVDATPLPFHDDAIQFHREDVQRIHLMLLNDYIRYANGEL